MRRSRIFPVIAALSFVAQAAAQRLDPEYYEYPLRDVAGYYSANFGEMRPNHFHSGVDLKTDGVEGKAVVAAADGYVSRILQSPSGYGLALYIAHPNGTTTVYGHLSRFRKDIADFVFAERHRLRSSRIDIVCPPDKFRVARGEEIARSGNTGSSMGPHLHYEIRDTETQKTHNVIAQGVLKPKDAIAPYMMKVHYIEIDTVRGIPVNARPATYAVRKIDGNTYGLARQSPVKVGRKGYFVVEASDRKDDCANTYGIYRLRAQVDGRTFFEYRNDGFTFDLSRYCNSVAYYPVQRNSRNEAIRLAAMQGGVERFYPTLVDRGVIAADAGVKRKIDIAVEDDCDNVSTLGFEIEGKPDAECFRGEIDDERKAVYCDRDFAFKVDDAFSVVIPKGALYESAALRIERSETTPVADSTVRILSPAYRVGDKDIPLHRSIAPVFSVAVDEALRPYVVMAVVADDGRVSYAGGNYRYNRLAGRASSFGTYCLAADTVPPVIKPQFADGQDCRNRDRIAFRVSDNFSGIASYTATVDGRWVAIDLSRGRASIDLRAEGVAGGGTHAIEFTLVDNCGNRAVWRGTIVR
ncbi:M23 family peptidase [Alistipes sp. Z76]|nr:M23 family peptidase [Alistipes sp. Z76]NCE66797.1 M23 family peptidase [Muribaculaceae bacterium M3]